MTSRCVKLWMVNRRIPAGNNAHQKPNSPHHGPRAELWNELKELADDISDEWCVGVTLIVCFLSTIPEEIHNFLETPNISQTAFIIVVCRTWVFMANHSPGSEVELEED
ncbi:hypothetical protein PIB30_037730 [Stylosanthes scabra]|uniref:Uncharacterized protein n=1 Tax=Stylosanthes scabra TaxID=79078 RepID=A0ABU6REB6_9FABA|nr:hypothetical protein [Stylosanthes scabra]